MNFQNGIYFGHNTRAGNSYAIVFLKIGQNLDTSQIADDVSFIWENLTNLEKGIVDDLLIEEKHRYSGNLSSLIGYSPRIFDLPGIKKEKPASLREFSFRDPKGDPRRKIANGVPLNFAKDRNSNIALDSDIIIQFIAENEAATSRAIVETWRLLHKLDRKRSSEISFIGFYTGFNSPDNRNLIYFHDGLSNIKSQDRIKNIFIDEAILSVEEKWLANSTFMSFLRMSINIELWETIPRKYQERIIGRDKLSGCPVIGVNKENENIVIRDCPVEGTSEVSEKGNEVFREVDRPFYASLYNQYDRSNDLWNSHIRKMTLQGEDIPIDMRSKIYRQGYSFVEYLEGYPFLKIGLNFVSFQNNLGSLYNMMKYGFKTTANSGEQVITLTDLLTVDSAGFFLVPGLGNKERFPGETFFIDRNNNFDSYADG